MTARPVCVFCARHRPGEMLALVDLTFDVIEMGDLDDEAVCFYCVVARLPRHLTAGDTLTLTVSRTPAEVTV